MKAVTVESGKLETCPHSLGFKSQQVYFELRFLADIKAFEQAPFELPKGATLGSRQLKYDILQAYVNFKFTEQRCRHLGAP